MKLLQAIALLSLLGSGCGEAIQGVETEAPDAQSIDVGDPSWPVCPSAWPPAPRLEYCGTVSETSCYEIDLPGVAFGADGVEPLLPCQALGEVVLLPAGDKCSECSAMGFGTTP